VTFLSPRPALPVCSLHSLNPYQIPLMLESLCLTSTLLVTSCVDSWGRGITVGQTSLRSSSSTENATQMMMVVEALAEVVVASRL
jgi:hypothetical protein